MTTLSMNGMRARFEQAKRLHGRATDEFVAAMQGLDRMGIRQAAEKAWLSVVEATKALLRARGQVAGGTGRQRDALFRMGQRNRNARQLPVLFTSARETLHISCFYDDEFTPPTIEIALDLAGEFIRSAERLAAERART